MKGCLKLKDCLNLNMFLKLILKDCVKTAEQFCQQVWQFLCNFDVLNIDKLAYSDGALREGVMYDLLGRFKSMKIFVTAVYRP